MLDYDMRSYEAPMIYNSYSKRNEGTDDGMYFIYYTHPYDDGPGVIHFASLDDLKGFLQRHPLAVAHWSYHNGLCIVDKYLD